MSWVLSPTRSGRAALGGEELLEPTDCLLRNPHCNMVRGGDRVPRPALLSSHPAARDPEEILPGSMEGRDLTQPTTRGGLLDLLERRREALPHLTKFRVERVPRLRPRHLGRVIVDLYLSHDRSSRVDGHEWKPLGRLEACYIAGLMPPALAEAQAHHKILLAKSPPLSECGHVETQACPAFKERTVLVGEASQVVDAPLGVRVQRIGVCQPTAFPMCVYRQKAAVGCGSAGNGALRYEEAERCGSVPFGQLIRKRTAIGITEDRLDQLQPRTLHWTSVCTAVSCYSSTIPRNAAAFGHPCMSPLLSASSASRRALARTSGISLTTAGPPWTMAERRS